MSSRFTLDNFIASVDNSFIQNNLRGLRAKALNPYPVPPSRSYRMDLISDDIYETTRLRTVLIYVNTIVDISIIQFGYTLYYPSIEDILSIMNDVQNN